MKRFKKTWTLAMMLAGALILMAAPRASAQNGTISGSVMDVTGKAWIELGMQAVSDQGAKQETKTDSSGKYSFHGLRPGVYSVFVVLPAPNPPYEVKCQVKGGEDTKVDVNFKDIIAKQGAAAQEQIKKQEEEKQKFEGMKAHFSAGNALLEQERQAKADLQKATPDQRDAAKQKLTDLSDQAAKEYQEAQKAAGEKDTNQHLIWAKLGEAYDIAGRNDEAANAYQQAITAKPDMPGYYNNLGNVLARAGKIDEAKAAYTKSAELDPTNAATAWRNFGISLYNAGRMKEAVEPLKKATQVDPKSAQAWYLLGASLVGAIDSSKDCKMTGDKMDCKIPDGTVEAYQKALDLDPNGQYGAQAKQGLEGLKAMSSGIETKVNVKKKKS